MDNFVLKKLDKASQNKAHAFVLEHEAFCVTLSSEFRGEAKFKVLYAIFNNDMICGVIAISIYDFLLHCLPDPKIFERNSELRDSLKQVLAGETISTIMGGEDGTKILQNLYGCNPVCEWEYFLMEYGGKKLDFDLPVQFMLRRCTLEDEESLFPLQKQYELVEVLPPGTEHNPARSRLGLRKALKTQLIFALFENKRAIAKAGSNAVGVNFAQIGGVFTDAAFRNRGFATFLTNYAAQRLIEKGKRVILFVKKKNESAKRAYKKAGFVQFGTFKIVYY